MNIRIHINKQVKKWIDQYLNQIKRNHDNDNNNNNDNDNHLHHCFCVLFYDLSICILFWLLCASFSSSVLLFCMYVRFQIIHIVSAHGHYRFVLHICLTIHFCHYTRLYRIAPSHVLVPTHLPRPTRFSKECYCPVLHCCPTSTHFCAYTFPCYRPECGCHRTTLECHNGRFKKKANTSAHKARVQAQSTAFKGWAVATLSVAGFAPSQARLDRPTRSSGCVRDARESVFIRKISKPISRSGWVWFVRTCIFSRIQFTKYFIDLLLRKRTNCLVVVQTWLLTRQICG